MPLTLDTALEARIQRELARGDYHGLSDVIAHALDLVEAEREHLSGMSPAAMEDWLLRNKEAINASLDRTFAQAARGEGYSPEESRALLAEHRAKRTAKAA